MSQEIEDAIGCTPMDNFSDDWYNFATTTKNLKEAKNRTTEGFFITDYGSYNVICIASANHDHKIKKEDIVRKDINAIYERIRNKIIVTDVLNESISKKINKILGIKSYFANEKYSGIKIPNGSTIFVGDN